MQVAKANDIKYAPTECHHEGDCAGSCPKCEAEVRWLEQQLQLRRQLGKAVAVVGVSMGLAALTSCESQLTEMNTDSNISSVLNQNNNSEWMGEIISPQPSFPGGSQALVDFLRENTKYPEQALKDSMEGRVVVAFVIDTDGSITKPEVVRGVHPLLDAEALRVVKLMPKWEPGSENGTPVKVRYNLPITFKKN
jgi:TonB family protein